jgi:hypothetical protein
MNDHEVPATEEAPHVRDGRQVALPNCVIRCLNTFGLEAEPLSRPLQREKIRAVALKSELVEISVVQSAAVLSRNSRQCGRSAVVAPALINGGQACL